MQLPKQLAPRHFRTLFIEAQCLIRTGQNEAAVTILSDLPIIKPRCYHASLLLSQPYLQQHALNQAGSVLLMAELAPALNAA